MSEQNHAGREHSEHGASICKRWWNCPGSVVLSRGLPNKPSAAAQEGTEAHELAAVCLETGKDAAECDVDAGMADAVQVYLDYCRSLPDAAHPLRVFDAVLPGNVMIERRFDLSPFDPPAPMFGTCDYALYVPVWRKLFVVDYKHGVGVNVEAAGNPQLKYYALGATLLLGPDQPVSEVEAVIVQPRAPGNRPIKTVTYQADELAEWSIELMARAEATLHPDAPLNPGDWCKFCPAAGVCKARATEALAVAQIEFGAAPADPPEIRLLTPAQVGAMLGQVDALESWAKALRQAAADAIQRGGDIPGWKLVSTTGRAAWIDADAAAFDLQTEHGLSESDVIEAPATKSPAQVRAALTEHLRPVHKTKKAADAAARALLDPLTHSPAGGLKLVPSADPRPAALVGGAEFSAISMEQ